MDFPFGKVDYFLVVWIGLMFYGYDMI
jgi:hypothetical protein